MTDEEMIALKQRMADAVSLRDPELMRDVLKDGYVADWPLGWGTEVRSPMLTIGGHLVSVVTDSTLLTAVIALDPFKNARSRAIRYLMQAGASERNIDTVFAGKNLLARLENSMIGPVLHCIAKECPDGLPVPVVESSKYNIAPVLFNRGKNMLVEPGSLGAQIRHYLGDDCGKKLSSVLSSRNVWGILHTILSSDDGFLMYELLDYPGLMLSENTLLYMLDACARNGCVRCASALQEHGAEFGDMLDNPTYHGDIMRMPDGTSIDITLRQQFQARLYSRGNNVVPDALEVLALADYCGTVWTMVDEVERKMKGVKVGTVTSLTGAAAMLRLDPASITCNEDLVATGKVLACRECGNAVAIVYKA